MRTSVIAALLTLICATAYTQEVVLEKVENKTVNPQAYLKTDSLKCEKTEKPEGVTAPEAELSWGRLVLGKRSYIICGVEKNRKLAKLWVDCDSDKDLKEETPVEMKGKSVSVGNLTGEFELGEGTWKKEMQVWILSSSLRNGYVGICEKYTGKFEAEGMKFTVNWFPGQEPRLRPESWRMEFPTFYFGKKKLSMGTKNLSLKDGKITAKWELAEDKELVEADALENLHAVTLHKRVLGWNAASVPVKGKVYLPQGNFSAVWADMRKKGEDGEYRLRVLLGSRDFEIKDKLTLGAPEPLTLAPVVTQRGDKVYVKANLTSALKGRVSLLKNGGRLNPPKLTVKDADGKEVASHVFKPG
jgi:hypothetical protein